MKMKKFLWIGVVILVFFIGAYFWSKKTPARQQSNIISVSPTAPPALLPTPTPITQNTSPPAVSTPPSPLSGITRGQIICDYQTPPAPNQFGVAKIISDWNNANINVCVSVNGNGQTLISSDNRITGSRTDSANWISSNTVYEFTLYNRHPGDPVCSGTALSSCQINTK
jgi:hypothetical protein